MADRSALSPGCSGLRRLVQGQQLDRHPGRRRHLGDRPVGEGEPGHRTAGGLRLTSAVACCQVGFLGRHGFTSILVTFGRAASGLGALSSVSGSLPHVRQRLENRLHLRVTWVIWRWRTARRRRRPRRPWRPPPTAGTCPRPARPDRSCWSPAAHTGWGSPHARRWPTTRCT